MPETITLFCTILLIAAVDWRKQIIPDISNFVLACIGAIALFTLKATSYTDAAAGLVVGTLVFLGLRAAYKRFRGVAGLGLGDVKFMGAAGLWVGLSGLPYTVLVASISGLATALMLFASGRGLNSQTRLPFGPHLALGLFVTWLCRLNGLV